MFTFRSCFFDFLVNLFLTCLNIVLLSKNNSFQALIANFSNAPPVLVDNRPTALNSTHLKSNCFYIQVLAAPNSAGFALLNSLASRGPPPKIPQRQYNTNEAAKGHGRSASLDLNTLAGIAGQLQKP